MLTSAPALKSISNHKALYHRPRLERHYVQVPTALLCGYEDLSDGAKVTYQVLLSFDYVDKLSGEHKGTVNPSIETIMTLRHKSRSTIYGHLAELEQCGLIEIIPGEGYRLYNVPEPAQERSECQSLPCRRQGARGSYSAPQTPSCEQFETSRDGEASASDTLTFQKSGQLLMVEEDNPKTEQYQYSEAGEHDAVVVGKLIKLGFDAYLARQFVLRYGAVRVDKQITNLCRALQSGVVIRSYPRWLYRAIERDYSCCYIPPQITRNTTASKHSIGEAVTLPNGEVVYTVLEYSNEG